MFSSVINRFADKIISEHDRLGVIPEKLDGKCTSFNQPRLLCNTRAIVFLSIYFELKDDKRAIGYAADIYRSIREHYGLMESYLNQLSSYELAFLALAQGRLYKALGNTSEFSLQEDIHTTVTTIDKRHSNHACFAPLARADCLELNSAMHIVEALGFLRCNGLVKDSYLLESLSSRIIELFFDKNNYLFAELISADSGDFLAYDLGHNFEWVSIIIEYGLSDLFDIDLTDLFNSARILANPTVGVIQPLVDGELNYLHERKRIWQSCEYLRASFNMQCADREYMIFFADCFFIGDSFLEFYGDEGASYKSTTGYHLIECYKKLSQF
ncbi:AGE family epimerase/isomerase [Pseudomonas sp. 5P_3.1_Bac2]|uniref:AGE family epimerase/isomerase n=1 Tax=Pseudomonas sp. 5P_3.1_Bac2 TaxID=2971617 RepID=UPI0021C9B2B0|nr:AGE family epimerase/isomerase [Pseudomonas sp. 5P_3.1_Bac2]MCU1718461.1 AGE family epimerase/isomerase [Pseudomonas sp. 5P_3.1_Bac2]